MTAPMNQSVNCLAWSALLLGALLAPATQAGEPLQVAVAANMAAPFADLAKDYAQASGQQALAVVGATSALAAQIENGAPLDILLSADSETPARLEASGAAAAGSRFTYARGTLVLFSMSPDWPSDGAAALRSGTFHHLAIANPQTAPYGRAALQTLHALGVHDTVADRLVFGNSVGQAFEFVVSGNAELGFAALSQVRHMKPAPGYQWPVPEADHAPLNQDAVLLTHAPHPQGAMAFLAYLRSTRARAILQAYGYVLASD